MHRRIPNILTILRILLALSGAAALWTSYDWSQTGLVPLWLGDPMVAARSLAAFALIAFIIAAATDWLDGWLARRWEAHSSLGEMLDPIADKLLVDAYLIVYMLILGTPVDIAVPVFAIVARDAIMTGMRLLPGADSAGSGAATLAVSPAAKLKTALAMIVAGFPLIAQPLGWQAHDFVLTGWILVLWITAALSLLTAWNYFRK
ncbi:CDP-alcohol phosphatidyltransferase family protein [uncultured Maricaulis sp.]|uniref:CDP-alcohol phosphatidyltransferase family protein n=1 Tax=uncultured Maricaulis sp. TaxID=174710 RepID=UPI0030DA92C9|tara:strand:- start:14206 stop:14817 length:612 start_codon:yes stop_codon:yes gene_type:complete